MAGAAEIDDGIAIRELIARGIEDGRELAKAEIALAKAKLAARLAGARNGIALIVAAVFLVQAALTTLLVGCALGLAHWVGPLGGAAIVFVVVLALAGIIGKIAVGQLTGGAPEPAKASLAKAKSS